VIRTGIKSPNQGLSPSHSGKLSDNGPISQAKLLFSQSKYNDASSSRYSKLMKPRDNSTTVFNQTKSVFSPRNRSLNYSTQNGPVKPSHEIPETNESLHNSHELLQ